MSRYDVTVVSSQKTNMRSMSSAVTSPSIEPANAVNTPPNRPRPDAFAEKYAAQ